MSPTVLTLLSFRTNVAQAKLFFQMLGLCHPIVSILYLYLPALWELVLGFVMLLMMYAYLTSMTAPVISE